MLATTRTRRLPFCKRLDGREIACSTT
eukprot:COSAG01_NODE_50253_length_364_cov_14.218868_1_plen_26_part_10